MTGTGNTVICCGVLRSEVEALARVHWPELRILFPDSMLHMNPRRLSAHLEALVAAEVGRGHGVLLIYGDCCPAMAKLERSVAVVRVPGNNCCELLLGKAVYRRLSRDGAFFMLPEWAHRWSHIFSVELGLNRENAAGLMGDMHSKLIYLDTGIVPVPKRDLDECSRYCGLPWEVMEVSLEPLLSSIRDALQRLEKGGPP